MKQGGRKKLVPAVAALDRSAEAARRARPLGLLIERGAAALGRVREALTETAVGLRLTGLSQEEQALFAGPAYEGQDLLEQSIEVPLSQSPEVQTSAGVKPEEGQRLREALDEVLRAQGAAQTLAEGAAHGRRLVGGLIAFACLRLCDRIERGLGQGDEELLGETARLRARVRARLQGQADTRAELQAEAGRLSAEASRSEAGAKAEATLEALRLGARPSDADLKAAAEHLRPTTTVVASPLPPATPAPRSRDRRRGDR